MGLFWKLSRRRLVKWGLISAGIPALSRTLRSGALAEPQVGGRADRALFTGRGLPGGGQLDIRLTVSPYTSDADEVEVSQRMKPFDVESWSEEWTRVAERNEQLAEKYAAEGRKVSANECYLRASNFYREASWPQPVDSPRMLPAYRKMRETFDKAWELARPPFDRVHINWEGKALEGYFRKPAGPNGKKFPTVIVYQGVDNFAEVTIMRTGGPYLARGMAIFVADLPGIGGSLRVNDLHAPPDVERVAKAVIDYLETRADVDASRIGVMGMGLSGFFAPRCACGEKRIKAVLMGSSVYSLQTDVFDYFPPFQERLRWLIGARDLTEARKRLAEYTLEGRANQIECAMLVGYSNDDRITDPQGALRLYQEAINSKREMVQGVGHAQAYNAGGPRERRPPVLEDWAARQLVEA
jgi:dienelactone hydrolase